MSDSVNRREFLGRSLAGGAALGLGLQYSARAASPNEQVTLGVVGLSRGARVAEAFASQPNCVIKTVCDVDKQRVAKCAADLEKQTGTAPGTESDLRRLFDDSDIDAVILALPAHWHAPGAMLACQAGKHVYVEKPCCHNPAEGEMLVATARHYKRAVQMGTQRRSWPVLREAIAKLHDGVIGRVYYSKAWYSNVRGSIGTGKEIPVPEQLDFDLWQGPAPRQPYKDNLVHYNWHWHWHWGTGELGNNGVHALDLSRWGLGVDYPIRVSSGGGRYHFADDQETPDTQVATYDFDNGMTISWEGLSCVRPGRPHAGFGASFVGEGGSVDFEGGGYVIRDKSGAETERKDGPSSDDESHAANFLTAVREGNGSGLNQEIEEGYKSTLLPLLGNIAYRVGHSIELGERGHILDDPAAEALWSREYEPGWAPKLPA